MAQNHPDIDAETIADCVVQFRKAKPHVHCITNSVAQHFTANVLLAAGATPSMTIAIEEVADFVSMADGLLINLGTMDAPRAEAIKRAVAKAAEQKKPWALDPVFVHASPLRLSVAKTLLNDQPALVRCNEKEGAVLFDIDLNSEALSKAAKNHETTIAMTGKMDSVATGDKIMSLSNGSAHMDRITTMGCALTALMVGFLAVEKDQLLATASALALFGIAGEFAERESNGPGSFVPSFLDALANLSANEIEAGVKLV